ncbi:MAG: hypothetical protein EA425_16520 [Puniceicoccaceae bacterium]|nr:MAG: hypothetical protein EA425_16520 [Puniceicoccaceae bacterium]
MPRPADTDKDTFSLANVIVGAVLSLLLGVVGAVLFLVMVPVVEGTPPAEDEIDRSREDYLRYYQPGTRSGQRGANWMLKKQALIDGRSGALLFYEEDLNLWAANAYEQQLDGNGTVLGVLSVPGTPVFRVAEDHLAVGLPVKLQLLGLERDIIVQAKGGFATRDGRLVFRPHEVLVGSWPVPAALGLRQRIYRNFAGAFPPPEDVREAWPQVEAIGFEDQALRVVIP